jgi:phosphatidylglycerophosphatase A
VATLAIIIIGIWSSNEVELLWGHDSARVVIDEIAGMAIAMIALPLNWKYFVTAFVLFRFFDIVKPLYIRKMELFPGGWGVMMDDVLAGIYALLLVQLMVRLNIF